MYSHPTDKQAQRRRYYRDNKEAIRQQAKEWYESNKGTSEYRLRKRDYMVIWMRRKKEGA